MNEIEAQKQFIQQRRQHFLSEERLTSFIEYYNHSNKTYSEWIKNGNVVEKNNGFWAIAANLWDLFRISYTRGDEIASLSELLNNIILAEKQAVESWRENKITLQNNGYYSSPMPWFYAEYYLKVLGLISVCYLLQREDLLERLLNVILANAEDGLEPDNTIEDFFYYRFKDRPDPDYIQMSDHAVLISEAIRAKTPEEKLSYLNTYLKDWYHEMVGMSGTEYQSHLDPEQNGFCGYWSFEAAAIAYLDDLDDTSLRQYPYYPKDMVDWAREQKRLRETDTQDNRQPLLLPAGTPAPFTGSYAVENFIGHQIHIEQGKPLPAGRVSAAYDDNGEPLYRQDTVWHLMSRDDKGKVRFNEEELAALQKRQ